MRGAGSRSSGPGAHELPRDALRATPRDRDRYLDLVRAVSILAVVVGHWLVTQFTWEDSQIELHSALGAVPSLWPVTWFLQVIPWFFFVGGFGNRRSWEGVQRRGEGYATFLDRRVHRLLAPTAVFLAAATAWSLVEALAGTDVLGAGGRIMLQPLWFLGVYIGVIALTPWTVALHRRWGWRVVAVLAAAVIVVDWVRLGLGHGSVAYVNVLLVWVLAHQLGYLYGDGRLTRRSASALAVAGLAVVATVVALGIYPARMVGVPGDRLVNMNPPTLALAALAVGQIGVAVLLADVVRPLLFRPRVWTAVVVVNLSIMSIYLWHQPALAVVARVGLPLGLPQPTPGSAQWWLSRPLWFALTAAVLMAAVQVVGRFEHRPPAPPAYAGPRATPAAVTAAVLLAPGLLALAGTDVTEVLAVHRVLRFLDVAPVLGLTCVVTAWLLLRGTHGDDRTVTHASLLASLCFVVVAAVYASGVGPAAFAPRAASLAVLFAMVVLVPVLVPTQPPAAPACTARGERESR